MLWQVRDVKKIHIYDTTLRDGTQGEGFQLSVLDKIAIAKRLDGFGIPYIECGWPGSNPKDMEFFTRAKSEFVLQQAKLVAFGSTRRANVAVEDDAQVQLLLDAETPVVTIFGKSWDLHVREVLRTTEEENRAMIRDTVAYLRSRGKEVVYDAEHFFDGYKANADFALQTLRAAAEGGASCLVLCDTNGGCLPHEVESLTKLVCETFPGVRVGIHTHNDCELAVANAIAAVRGGATHIQGTMNGYGERTGNCNLTSVIPILQLKMQEDVVPNLAELRNVSYFVDDVSNNPHFSRTPFVGKTAFAHKGGMHVNAVKKLAETYEHIRPEWVGNEQAILVSELSGQDNILMKAEELGLPLEKGSREAKRVLELVKSFEHEGYSFESGLGTLELLIRRELGISREVFTLKEYHTSFRQYRDGHAPVCEATVKLFCQNQPTYTVSEGDGVVNALDLALRKALIPFYPEIEQLSLVDYKVRIVDGTETTGAKTRVLLTTTDGIRTWSTIGVSTSIIEASWIALSDGLDLFLQRKFSEKTY